MGVYQGDRTKAWCREEVRRHPTCEGARNYVPPWDPGPEPYAVVTLHDIEIARGHDSTDCPGFIVLHVRSNSLVPIPTAGAMKPQLARTWVRPFLFGTPVTSALGRPPVTLLRTFFTSTPPSAESRVPLRAVERSALLYLRHQRSVPTRRFPSLRCKSHKSSPQHPDPTPHLGSPESAPSLSQRLKQLSREYGWAAVGVYFGLSLLDFPFCFLAVRLLGTDRIGHYEDVVKSAFWSIVRVAFPEAGKQPADASTADGLAEATAREENLGADDVVMRTDTGANASMTLLSLPPSWAAVDNETAIWTQLGLAYLVHKSLIFFRVPLTAAVLPKVVKTLRKWGYNIGKQKPRAV